MIYVSTRGDQYIAKVGDTLSSAPDKPLSPDTVDELTANDHIVTAIPLAPRKTVTVETVEWLLLQTTTTGVFLEYVPEKGLGRQSESW